MKKTENMAIMNGCEFKRLLRTLRPYVDKIRKDSIGGMIELWFDSDTVRGYACNGVKIVQVVQPCSTSAGKFVVYIRSPRLWPYDTDSVIIKALPDGQATVSFGEVQFSYCREYDPNKSLRGMYEKLDSENKQKEDRRTIQCNPHFLFDVATSLVEFNRNYRTSPIDITMGPAKYDPIFFKSGDMEAYLLPIASGRRK